MKNLVIICCCAVLLLAGCGEPQNRAKGVYMLLDTSGTYALELKKAQNILNYLLGTLQPKDTLAVARIDTGSFSEKDIIAKVTFDTRPSVANNQKRAFKTTLDGFIGSVKSSRYTDISGGMLQAIEYLNEAGSGQNYILIFSDLKEDLKKGFVRDVPFELDNYRVVALNVTKLRADNVDPKVYMGRVAQWQGKVEEGGGKWKVINDLERLENLFVL
ncbi:MAG: hypothetical protein [Olavius algarvensis Delta 4 endosymbiont]|nr:MAG: hypothetical protein [Olavius algarvensis Delta 4 endosymbiont]